MKLLANPLYITLVIAGLILVSDWLVKKTFLKTGGTALLVIILMAIASNFGLVANGSEAPKYYGIVQNYVAPFAIFLLLLDVNLKNLKKAGGPMLLMFFIGSAGVFAGTLLGYWLVPGMKDFGSLSAPLSGMYLATYTGGGLNFNAVGLHYQVMKEGTLFAGAVAVDNVMTTLWMAVTIQGPILLQKFFPRKDTAPEVTGVATDYQVEEKISYKSLSQLIFWGIGVIFLSEWLADYFKENLGVVVPSILILTTIALVMAQFDYFHKMKGTQIMGLYLVYFFLATVGAYCEIPSLFQMGSLAETLFLFVLIIMIVHGLIIFGSGSLLKMDWYLVSIASQANIGGQTTAMALAESFNKKQLLLPAILVGTLGNGIGTYLGFLLAALLAGN